MNSISEIIILFLRLGVTAFGGPAAHIAMMEDEIVTKRKWMSRQHFLDLIGATNLIPGPNSTEMALHCGYTRAGVLGLIAAGVSFIIPAVLITGILAYFYVSYGNLPVVEPFLYGIKPVVVVLILNAVYKLSEKAFKNWKLIVIGISVAVINLLGVNEIFSILTGGILGAGFIYFTDSNNRPLLFTLVPVFLMSSVAHYFQNTLKDEISLSKLFLIFLKIGAVLFGSGYVLIAYLDGEIVQGVGWITRQQLLDAIAVGQFTPGPVLSTATFIGYQIAGIPGALIATTGIFLPSFILVLIINPLVPKLRNSRIFSVFLDAVNASALAVMFAVALKLGSVVITDFGSIIIALLSAAAFLFLKKLNTAYIILGGALLGYLFYLLGIF